MSSLLAHIKIVEGKDQKFEELSKELYKQSHAKEDCIIRYEYYRGREKNSYYTLLVYPTYLDFLLKHFIVTCSSILAITISPFLISDVFLTATRSSSIIPASFMLRPLTFKK